MPVPPTVSRGTALATSMGIALRRPLMTFDHEVLVLGAGISGLTVAHALHVQGFDVCVCDRRPVAGGKIQTLRQNGFLVENGPTSMISPAVEADRLIADLGLADERIGKTERVRHRYLVRDGLARALPISPGAFFFNDFFSLPARLRLLAEPFVRRNTADETIATFVRRRFGKEMLDYVFDPLVGGLYSADPETVSAQAVFPQLKLLEARFGSVIRGVVSGHLRRRGASAFDPRRRQLSSLRDGMGRLPQRLREILASRIRSGLRAESLSPLVGGGYRVGLRESGGELRHLRAGRVVLALPAYAAGRLLQTVDAGSASFLNGIAHPPMSVVGLGYRTAALGHPLDGLGVLNPSCEGRNTLGLMFSSSLFAGRAPAGHELITAYVGGARQPELTGLPREELIDAVRTDVRQLLDGRDAPVFTSVRYWQRGLPQPAPGHVENIRHLRQQLAQSHPGLHLAGNYVNGVSTVNCIATALNTASEITRARSAEMNNPMYGEPADSARRAQQGQ